MPIPIDLIPADRIQRFGPKRLKPMHGQHQDPKTKVWSPKYPKPTPDPRDRERVKEKLAEVASRGPAVESPSLKPEEFKPLAGFILVKGGEFMQTEMGMHIPAAHRIRRDWFTVVVSERRADFKAGDRVFLDKNARLAPIKFGDDDYCIVNYRSVAAILRT